MNNLICYIHLDDMEHIISYLISFVQQFFACMQVAVLIMQQGQKSSKKWVDFSDQSEQQFDSDHEHPKLKYTQSTPVGSSGQAEKSEVTVDHRSAQFIQLQLKRYNDARQQYRQIWVLLQSEDQTLLDKKIRDLKDNIGKEVINVYTNKDVKGGWDVKVEEKALEGWIKDGLDKDRTIKVTVSDRNFRSRGERPRGDGERRGGRGRGRGGDRGERGERGDRRGRGGDRRERGERGERKERDPNEPKKVYVDKNTGSLPNNKVEVEQKIILQKQRHYTKQQAEKVGAGLGNFRNKTKTDNPPEVKVDVVVNVPAKKVYKQQVKPWARKQREAEDTKEEKKVDYREKEPQEGAQKKKKVYVRVDNLPNNEKQQLKVQKPANNGKHLLSEDSN